MAVRTFRIDPSTLDFPLPDDLIAQEPLAERDQARLLVVDRAAGTLRHARFSDLPSLLEPGDVVVLNRARVDRARLAGRKASGGRIEVILLGPLPAGRWRALVRPVVKPGVAFTLGTGLAGRVEDRLPTGEYALGFDDPDPLERFRREGELPLPPYIKRAEDDPRRSIDEAMYQTVYATAPGSVAAPTAGLHFTPTLLGRLGAAGIATETVVLHVGWGTFRPIAGEVANHRMLAERYELAPDALDRLYAARAAGRRIVAVGTTCTRTLESLPDDRSAAVATGETDLFIRPGFRFRWVGALVTNLHVPRSTPVALTAAFAGLGPLENAYAAAVEERYRFFSYGDAMLVL